MSLVPLPAKGGPRFKFEMMMKAGVPLGAIKLSMEKEGFDPASLTPEMGDAASSSGAPPLPKRPSESPVGPTPSFTKAPMLTPALSQISRPTIPPMATLNRSNKAAPPVLLPRSGAKSEGYSTNLQTPASSLLNLNQSVKMAKMKSKNWNRPLPSKPMSAMAAPPRSIASVKMTIPVPNLPTQVRTMPAPETTRPPLPSPASSYNGRSQPEPTQLIMEPTRKNSFTSISKLSFNKAPQTQSVDSVLGEKKVKDTSGLFNASRRKKGGKQKKPAPTSYRAAANSQEMPNPFPEGSEPAPKMKSPEVNEGPKVIPSPYTILRGNGSDRNLNMFQKNGRSSGEAEDPAPSSSPSAESEKSSRSNMISRAVVKQKPALPERIKSKIAMPRNLGRSSTHMTKNSSPSILNEMASQVPDRIPSVLGSFRTDKVVVEKEDEGPPPPKARGTVAGSAAGNQSLLLGSAIEESLKKINLGLNPDRDSRSSGWSWSTSGSI